MSVAAFKMHTLVPNAFGVSARVTSDWTLHPGYITYISVHGQVQCLAGESEIPWLLPYQTVQYLTTLSMGRVS